MAGRTIVPRYLAFTATSVTAATAVQAYATSATGGGLYPAMEVEGFDRTIAAVESAIEDGQTSLDAMDITVSGYIRGTGLLADATVNLPSATGARVYCNVWVVGAGGTLGVGIKNVQVNAMYDITGQKERVMFKGTKRFVRDINSTGADVVTFTS
jgi:hypothetical protein